MNSVSLIGRLTADPETRYFESGKVVAKFSIAVNRTKDEADFFEIEAWEKTAEVVSQYCKKGFTGRNLWIIGTGALEG